MRGAPVIPQVSLLRPRYNSYARAALIHLLGSDVDELVLIGGDTGGGNQVSPHLRSSVSQ